MTRRSYFILMPGLGLFSVATAAMAESEVTSYVDVSAGSQISSNPYLSAGSSNHAVSGWVQIDPTIAVEDSLTTVSLRGSARYSRFNRRYGSEGSYLIGANGEHRISDSLLTHAGVNFRSSRSNAGQLIFGDNGVSEPIPGTPDFTDVTVLGQPLRTTSFGSNAGITYLPSANDEISFDVNASQSRYKSPALDDFSSYGASVGYSKRLSEQTQLTASASVNRADYLGRKDGDALTISPTIGLTQRLSETLRASVSGGVTISRITLPAGTHQTYTNASFNANLCNGRERSNLCLTAAHSVQPTAVAGLRRLTRVSMDYSNRISENGTVGASVGWDRTSAPQALAGDRASRLSGNLRYSHRIREGLSADFSAGYGDLYSRTSPGREANVYAQVGLRYRFGGNR